MTRVVQKNTRCIKCGKNSVQLRVYSDNLNINESRYQQKCPYCNYTAPIISISNQIISYEEKINIAKKIYDNLELKEYELQSNRDEDILADYFYISNLQNTRGIIIGDDGGYLLCRNAYGYEYHKEKYKNGERNN